MDGNAFNERIRHKRAVWKLREAEIEEQHRIATHTHEEVKERFSYDEETLTVWRIFHVTQDHDAYGFEILDG